MAIVKYVEVPYGSVCKFWCLLKFYTVQSGTYILLFFRNMSPPLNVEDGGEKDFRNVCVDLPSYKVSPFRIQ
jgi:hypothetical protein